MSKKYATSETSVRIRIKESAPDLIKVIPGDENMKVNVASQVYYAALGAISPELGGGGKLPILKGCSSPVQYNRYEAAKRAERMLKEDWWQATAIAEHAVEALRREGIAVDQVKLLLDPKYESVRKEAFKALHNNCRLNDKVYDSPTSAALAISRGLVPAPDTSWASRLSLAASGPVMGTVNVARFVNTHECYLWVFPPAWSPATAAASLDRFYTQGQAARAEMGMGFSIIEAPWKRPYRDSPNGYYNQYSVYTPLWDFRNNTPSVGEGNWRLCNIIPSQIRDGVFGSEKFSKLLPRGLHSLPRVHGCEKCETLFISNHPAHTDVPTGCKCGNDK